MRDPVRVLIGSLDNSEFEWDQSESPILRCWPLVCIASTGPFKYPKKEEDVVDTNETNVGKMESQLKRWGAQLDDLADKANNSGAEAKADYRELLDDFKAKFDAAQSQFDELKSASSQQKNMLGDSLKKAWGEVEEAVTKLNR